MKQKIDIANWNRREYFEFFSKFDEPYTGVTVEVDCTIAYKKAKENGDSFYLYYLYKSLEVINNLEAFRYKVEEDGVYLYDRVEAEVVVFRPDTLFTMTRFPYYKDFTEFQADAKRITDEAKKQNTLRYFNDHTEPNSAVVHYTAVPWLRFTELTHARNYSNKNTPTKISFGKLVDENGVKKMPVSILAHHGLANGYDIAQFVEQFQELLNS